MLDECEKKVGNEFGRHYGEANKSMKRLISWLLKLDMNVIITSHSKNEYGDQMKVIGQVPDCYKKLDYIFDLVMEVQNRNGDRFAKIIKSRIKNFVELEMIPFSFEEISKRYGLEEIERDAVPLKLASQNQLDRLNSLIELLKVPSEVTEKWFKKAEVSSFSEMNDEMIQKCIDLLDKKLDSLNIKGENDA